MSQDAVSTKQIEQLKLIYDYAKFHIGLYATVSAALIGVTTFNENLKKNYMGWLLAVLGCFLAAGIGGGLVAGHVVYSRWDNPLVKELLKGYFTPTLSSPRAWNRYKWFTFIEHYAFWLGLLLGIIGLIINLN
jgi:hypothetical protein